MKSSLLHSITKNWLTAVLGAITVVALLASVGFSFLANPQIAHAATEVVTNGDFGSGETLNDIPNWEERGNEGDDSVIAKDPTTGNESVSPNGGRFARIGRFNAGTAGDGFICQEIDATNLEDLELGYYWRGDVDAENSGDDADFGYVEYLLNGSCESADDQWTNLALHDDIVEGNDEQSPWTLESIDLPSDLDGKEFFLRFRSHVTSDQEFWRVDGVSLEGDEILQEPNASLRICKLIVDAQGNIIDGSEAPDADFTISVDGPEFDKDEIFSTTLSLNTDLVDDNDGANDAQCVVYDGLYEGHYTYDAETIDSEGLWGTVLYHDYFDETPTSVSGFYELTVDGSENDEDNADGVINLVQNSTRTLAVVNTFLGGQGGSDNACTVTIVSDTTNTVTEKGGAFAEALGFVHTAWTAVIADATWIWGDNPVVDPTVNETQTFVKTFEWSGGIASAVLDIAADNFYTVTLNGTEIGSEQIIEDNFRSTTQDSFDVSGDVIGGVNTLEIEVINKKGNSNPQNNPAGLLYNLTIVSTEEGEGCMNSPEPETPWCSFVGEVIDYTADEFAFTNGGALVNPDRRHIAAVETVAPYQNIGGKEGNDWQVNPLDFFSLGIEGYLVYEFTEQVAFDQTGDDIAVYEITGGTGAQTDEKVEVWVSQDGGNFVYVDTVSGDGSVDISGTGLDYVKFVKLIDDSVDIQGSNGDGYDVDAIVILNGSCGDQPPHAAQCELDVELLLNGGFESPVVTHSSKWDVFPSGTVGLEWAVEWLTGNVSAPDIANIELQKNGLSGWLASEGNQWTELDSDWNGHTPGPNGEKASVAISQTINTEIGATYTTSFDFSPRPKTNKKENKVEVLANAVVIGTVGPAKTSGNQTEWSSHSFDFVADSTETTLTFRDAGNKKNSVGTFIDNTSLVCSAIPHEEPQLATVTMCKFDDQKEPLSGWTLTLLGDKVDEFAVPSGDFKGINSVALGSATPYVAIASGVWLNDRKPDNHVDAEYSTEDSWLTQVDGFPGHGPGILELEIAETDGDWGPYNSLHKYAQAFVPGLDGPVNFRMFDGNTNAHTVNPSWYGDNKGSLDVVIHEGYAGVTDETGCVVFDDVPFGEYVAGEIEQEGWTQEYGPENPVQVDTELLELSLVNSQEPPFSTVTMCKYDESENPLADWTLTLLGDYVETVDVPSDGIEVFSTNTLDGNHVFVANGTYVYRPSAVGSTTDAAFSMRSYTGDPIDPTGHPFEPWVLVNDFASPWEGYLGITVDGALGSTDWGSIFNPLHEYALQYVGDGDAASFHMLDSGYGDNSGSLTVDIHEGYAGVTNETGCVVFDEVPFGEYVAGEIQQEGWVQKYGPENPVQVDDETLKLSFINTQRGEETEETIVVDTNNHHDWSFFDETNSVPLPDNYVFGPGTAPLGDGSARLVAAASGDRQILGKASGPFLLSDVTRLEYQTYQESTTGAPAIALQFNIDDDITDIDDSWKGRLVYEPYYTHTILEDTWQSWDTLDNSTGSGGIGNWWFSNGTLATNTGCSISGPCTWDEIVSAIPNGGVHPTLGAMLFKVGSGWTGFDGNVDEFVIGIKNGLDVHTTTYDFEPIETVATLTIHKETDYGDGEFNFTVSDGFNFLKKLSLKTDDGEAWSEEIALPLGTYSVLELVPDDWYLEEVYCEYNDDHYYPDDYEGGLQLSFVPENTGSPLSSGYEIYVVGEGDISCYFYNEADHQCGESEVFDYEEGACVPRNGDAYSDLSVEKTVNDETPKVGEQVTYTITLANDGPDVAGNIAVIDALPDGVTYVSHIATSGTYATSTGMWTVLSLGDGGSTTLTIVATIDSGEEGQIITNLAEISGSDSEDNNDSNDAAGAEVLVEDGSTPPSSPPSNPPTFGPLGGGITGLGGGGGLVLGASTSEPQQCSPLLTSYMRIGFPNDTGEVSILQDFLNRHMSSGLEVTGFFGEPTEDAVKRFQWEYRFDVLTPWGISQPTGIAYLTTLRKINMIECSTVEQPLPPLVEWPGN